MLAPISSAIIELQSKLNSNMALFNLTPPLDTQGYVLPFISIFEFCDTCCPGFSTRLLYQ